MAKKQEIKRTKTVTKKVGAGGTGFETSETIEEKCHIDPRTGKRVCPTHKVRTHRWQVWRSKR